MNTEIEDTDERLLAQVAAAPPIAPDLGGAHLDPGTIVAGTYRIEHKVGQGGMGVVYRAHDLELDRPVAIKLHTHEANEMVVRRLTREAQAMAKLSHPNVLTIYEIGRHQASPSRYLGERSLLFIAVEFIVGGTLRDWLDEGTHGWREVTQVFVQAGRGLAAAHHAGVIHRDFKPDNVLIDERGRVRVADFGLARAESTPVGLEDQEIVDPSRVTEPRVAMSLAEQLTTTGTVLGTRAYMAPEQGEAQPVDARADQYAFCVSLHEGLYGRRPFDRGIASAAVRRRKATRDPHVPRRLQRVITRGLAADPAGRFASMDALVAELEAVVAPRTSRVLVSVGAMGVAAALAWTTLSSDDPPCNARSELRGVWDDARGEELAAAFVASAQPYAQVSLREVNDLLDDYAQMWVLQRQLTCHGQKQHSDLTARKISCLDRRRQRLGALVSTLVDGGTVAIEGAVEAATSLHTPAECDRPEILAAEPLESTDPAIRMRDQEAERRLLRLEALVATGAHRRSTPQIATLRELLNAGSRPDQRRRLEALDRHVSVIAGDLDRAQAAAEASLNAALSEGTPVHLPSTAAAMARTLARQGKLESAAQLLRMAESAAEALSPDLRVQAELASTRGLVLWCSGKVDESIAAYETAISLTAQALGPLHPELAWLLFALTEPLSDRGDFALVLETADRGLAIMEQTHGPDHPLTAHHHEARAHALYAMRRLDEAVAASERAIAMYQARLGPFTPVTLRSMSNLAGTLLAQKLDGGADLTGRALSLLRSVLDELEARGLADSAEGVATLIKLGQAHWSNGDPQKAIELLERGLTLIESHSMPDLSDLLAALSGLAEAYSEVGRVDEALDLLARACRRALEQRPLHSDTALLHLQTTMRLLDGRRFEDARTVGEQALALIEQSFGPRHSLFARTLVQLGRAELHLADPLRAVERLERALELAVEGSMVYPSQPGLRYLIARAYRDAGQTERLREAAAAALEIWPEDGDTSYGTRDELLAWVGPARGRPGPRRTRASGTTGSRRGRDR